MGKTIICNLCGWKIMNDPEIIKRHNDYWHKKATNYIDPEFINLCKNTKLILKQIIKDGYETTKCPCCDKAHEISIYEQKYKEISKFLDGINNMDEKKQIEDAQVKASNKIQQQIDQPKRRMVMHVIMVDEFTGKIIDQKTYPQLEPVAYMPEIKIVNKTGSALQGKPEIHDDKITIIIDNIT